MTRAEIYSRRVFRIAAVYGLLALVPQYLLEDKIGRDFPPAITHPEHFYGFLGVAVAWQLAFLVIAADPRRYRALMPVAVFEKLAFGIAAAVLYSQGRVHVAVLGFGIVDIVLALLFVVAYLRVPAWHARPH